MSMKANGRLAGLLLLIGLLAACRSGASGPPPPPTLTPTPMSTPLPTIPPTVAPGSADNPVRVVLVSAATGRAADAAVRSLQEAVQDAANLTLDVETATIDRDGVQALCGAFDGPQALAFVSGLGYAAATALGCGETVFVAQGADDATSREIIVIASEDSEITALAGLNDKTLCRLSDSDLDTWLAPSLLMLSEGLSPTSTLREVVDVADLDALVAGVASGDCDAAALPAAEFERITDFRHAGHDYGTAANRRVAARSDDGFAGNAPWCAERAARRARCMGGKCGWDRRTRPPDRCFDAGDV